MIEEIEIKSIATYDGATPEKLSDLKKVNFVYGSNGTGKTTIARVIANEAVHPCCTVKWRGGMPLETMVYNRDFIENNFNQPNELKGIFTLGEQDKETIDKIDSAKNERDSITEDITTWRNTLEGEDDSGGKIGELKKLESYFEERCWELKQEHDAKFKDAFTGYRGSKQQFKAKLLEESTNNSATSVPLVDLEQRARTVFGKAPTTEQIITVPNSKILIEHENNPILRKKIIGKTDVDIAALIQKLGNSDWVKKGREFYDPETRVCPFCQQGTKESLEKSLEEYFDEAFEKDSAGINTLVADYKSNSEHLQQSLQALLDNPSEHIDTEKLQAGVELLASKRRNNIRSIEEKQREPSKLVELESLRNVLDNIKALIDDANTKIENHNVMVSNLAKEKAELTSQVWRYLLDHGIMSDLATFNKTKLELNKAITSLRDKISNANQDKLRKEQEIRALEKNTTSIQPTIDGINNLLGSIGFTGFVLAKSERDRFYKIKRPDGSDAKETLSEGESSFIAFLYFYYLLKGSESETGMTSDRVVVFDDPVSSLDSNILFIVSSLIKGLFDEVRSQNGMIKQVFVLTHNVYFHKEVSFNRKRQKRDDETFWTVRKANLRSKIQSHETNPIKTAYELLWNEVKNPCRDNLAIQNTLRRILEYYYEILGNADPDSICNKFDGKEKLICKSLFSWVNDGSHSVHDSLYVSIDSSVVDTYLSVFKRIFIITEHEAHYKMMMRENE